MAFWRLCVIMEMVILMKDIRISIRLTEDEHYLFKILAVKKKKSMQELLKEYIKRDIEKEKKDEKEKKN